MLFTLINKYAPNNAKNDILSGMTVALALVPEAVAFALLAGVGPLVGLYAAFTIGIVTSIIGGRPGMISGATGAIAVVIGTLVAQHGVEYLFAAVIMTGLIQITFGVFKMGKFIRLVPHPVFLGFVNGLAMVIFISQIKQFKVGDDWITGSPLMVMLVIIAATMVIIHFLPRFSKTIPSTLVAIVVGSVSVIWMGLDTRTVGDIASIKGGLPIFHIPDVGGLTWEMIEIVFPYAIVMALVGLIESLLTLNLIDDLTQTVGKPNKEAVAQGVANTVTGLFGGMGGCAMVGQSLINIKSGGRGRLSTLIAGLFLIIMVVFLDDWISQIPMAALVAVMIMVSIGTFSWTSIIDLNKSPLSSNIVMISTVVVVVFTHNLALGVLVGVLLAALFFANKIGRYMAVKSIQGEKDCTRTYRVVGQVFFASSEQFIDSFDFLEVLEEVTIDVSHAHFWDITAVAALDKVVLKFRREGAVVDVIGMNEATATIVDGFGVHDKPDHVEQLLESH